MDCRIKWPNDLLLNGKKVVGILCESVSYGYQMQGRGIVCGIGMIWREWRNDRRAKEERRRRRMEEADDPEAEEADGEADEAPEAFKDEEEER